MSEVVSNTTSIWQKIQAGDIAALTISDIIWIVGLIVLGVIAVKIGYKLAKIIFVLAVVAFIIYFLVARGIIIL